MKVVRVTILSIVSILSSSLFLLLTGLTIPAPAYAQDRQPPLPTTAEGSRPDACEPNDRRGQACNLALDVVAGPFTFLPADDQDWYRVDLGAPRGLETTITVRAAGDLGLLTSISRDDGTPLRAFSSPIISTTLAADVGGPISIHVENRAEGAPIGSTYGIEVRTTLPPPSAPHLEQDADRAPDGLENNWNPETAAPIAVGVVYDLNFVCPVRGGCEGGDHDYLLLPVKAGTQYLIATFDLGPGVDTVIDLFWGSEERPLITNDDARPGGGFLSVLRWHAPADGVALLRVGPRNGGLHSTVTDPKAQAYRFAVALARSEFAAQLEERIAAQTNVPTPTPVPSAVISGSSVRSPVHNNDRADAPVPAAAVPASVPQGDALKGSALVLRETALRLQPDTAGTIIQTLAAETTVTLLGAYHGLWVRVQTADAVLPGWMLATDLRRLAEGESRSTANATATSNATTQPGPTITITPAATRMSATLQVEPLAPLPQDDLIQAPMHISRSISVTVVAAAEALTTTPAALRATSAPVHTLSGVRVQLVNAFGEVLAEAMTPTSGPLVLTREVDTATALFVRLPAAGIQVRADQSDVQLAIRTERVP